MEASGNLCLCQAVAKRLLELLSTKGLTRYALCKNIGMNETTLYNVINNKTHSVNLDTVFWICEGLDISLCDFFDSHYFDKTTIELK